MPIESYAWPQMVKERRLKRYPPMSGEQLANLTKARQSILARQLIEGLRGTGQLGEWGKRVEIYAKYKDLHPIEVPPTKAALYAQATNLLNFALGDELETVLIAWKHMDELMKKPKIVKFPSPRHQERRPRR